MNPRAHLIPLLFAFCFAALMTGCVSSDHRTAQRIEPASDFEVVETSAQRPLTAKEMGELRGTVARYLDQQGETGSGDYYLKVYLSPETEGVTPEWVVVRFTRYDNVRVNVASSYPGYDYPYSPSYYSYDTYPYGYGGFGRISFQYYDDPFYGRRYYYPRHDHRNHDRPHKPGDHNHHPPGGVQPPGGVVNHPQPRPENPRRRTPDRIAPSSQRPETANRPRDGINNPGAPGRPINAGNPSRPPRSPESDRQWRGRNENSGTANAPRPPSPPRAEARNEQRSSPPVYRAPDRVAPSSSSSNSNSSDRREIRDDGKKSGNQP
jgi:hypothetical protein